MLISGCWILVLYYKVLDAGFVYDDLPQIQLVTRWDNTLHILRQPYSFDSIYRGIGGSFYRPLFWLSLALDEHVWGLAPIGFHVTNLVLHWLVGILIFLTLVRLGRSRLLSVCVTLVWIALPINSEVVAWISGRTYSLAGVFLFAGLLSAINYVHSKKVAWLIASLLAGMAACLSNDAGLLIMPLLILTVYVCYRKLDRYSGALLTTSGLTIVCFLTARSIIGASTYQASNSLFQIGTIFWKYIAWIVLPIGMSIERSTDMPPNKLAASAIIGMIAILAGCVAIASIRRRWPAAAVGLLWLVVALLPFCGIIAIYVGMAERYAYLASIGFSAAIVSVAFELPDRPRKVWTYLLLAWMVWGVIRLEMRTADWHDELSLYSASLEATPRSSVLSLGIGNIYLRQGELQKAEAAYKNAIAYKPRYLRAINNLGAVYQHLRMFPEAEREYQESLSLDSNKVTAYCNLGALLFEEGKTSAAKDSFSKALRIGSDEPDPYCDLAVVYLQEGNYVAAAQLFTAASHLGSDCSAAQLRSQ